MRAVDTVLRTKYVTAANNNNNNITTNNNIAAE
jgi:hypothetical protein